MLVHDVRVDPAGEGWEPIARVIEVFEFVPEVTGLPPASSTATTGWDENFAPVVEAFGDVVKAS